MRTKRKHRVWVPDGIVEPPPENLVLLRRAQGECREGAAGKKRQRRARRLC